MDKYKKKGFGMDIVRAIKRLKDYYGIKTDASLAEVLEMSKSTFSENVKKLTIPKKETGKQTSSLLIDIILKRCLKDDINPSYIFAGKYPITAAQKTAQTANAIDLEKYISPDTISIPYFSDIRSSMGAGGVDDVEVEKEYIVIPKFDNMKAGRNRYQAIKVEGDSMLPNIANNSIIIVDTSDKFTIDNAVYVCVYGGDIYIKRIQNIDDSNIFLKSDNASYKTILAQKTEVTICGRVTNSFSFNNIR